MQLKQEHHLNVNFLSDTIKDKQVQEFAEDLEKLMNKYRVYRIDANLSPYSKSVKIVNETNNII